MDLKLFRKSCKLSQSEIADLFGCSAGHISNIESGSRSITALQIRLLIEKYGLEAVSKYADPGELPATPTVTIDMHKQTFSNNSAPIQNGDGNSMTVSDQLLASLKTKDDQITTLLNQQQQLINQQQQFINLLSAKFGVKE